MSSGGTKLPPSDPRKRNRAVATRYDKLAVRYKATLHIAALGEWLRPLTSQARPRLAWWLSLN